MTLTDLELAFFVNHAGLELTAHLPLLLKGVLYTYSCVPLHPTHEFGGFSGPQGQQHDWRAGG